MAARLRSVLVLAGALLGGCGLVTGVGDLEIVPESEAENPARTDGATKDAETGAVLPPDASPKPDAAVDAAPDAPPPVTRLRTVTFENGTVTGTDGVDSVTGLAMIQDAQSIDGKHSLAITTGAAIVGFPAQSDVWITWSSAYDSSAARLLATIGQLTVEMVNVTSVRATIRIRLNGNVIGTSSSLNVTNSPIRIGVHLKSAGQNGFVEAWARTGTGPLGQPFLSEKTANFGFEPASIALGAPAGDGATDMLIDDVLVDNGALPP